MKTQLVITTLIISLANLSYAKGFFSFGKRTPATQKTTVVTVTRTKAAESMYPQKRNSFTVGAAITPYEYREPGLMKIYGQLLGVTGEYKIRLGPGHIDIHGEIYKSLKTTYDGHLLDEARTPIVRSSDDMFTAVEGSWRQSFVAASNIDFYGTAGGGIRYLDNKISGAGSYRREQLYLYSPLGLGLKVLLNGRDFWFSAKADYYLFLGGKNKSHMSQVAAGNQDIEMDQAPGAGSGGKLSVSLSKKLTEKVMSISLFAKMWRIEDSSMDNVYGQFKEPKNETDMFGVNATLTF